jgi:UDP-GlcNAc3NAcA epimerase
MKVLTIIGARPQFIKAAALSRAIAANNTIIEVLVHTGQHFDANMSDIFFKELDIPLPSYNLGLGGGLHGAMTGRMLERLEQVMQLEKPDWVLVYGDTNSTLAGALAAVKLHIPVAHVEAGLRSFNKRMPEEVNRILTDHISELLFTPTDKATENLINENFSEKKICQAGDVMFDSVIFFKDKALTPDWFFHLGIIENKFILATIHRAENTDDPIRLCSILEGLGNSCYPVILPLHPRTRSKIAEYKISIPNTLHVINPVGYLDMIWLEANCSLIATDSGGIQKEAYFFGKPCITLRDETEWIELVNSRSNSLVGINAKTISDAIAQPHIRTENNNFLYGHGDAAVKIINRLLK